MELQYIVLTIIKILISVPAIVLVTQIRADGAALIGGHINNASSKPVNLTTSYDFKIDLSDESSQDLVSNETKGASSEEIPDPSPLVVPGYNLPDKIFNQGKPFYLEKDPLTGNIDFESKSSSSKEYEYEYEDEPMYDKVPIDRKDGPIGGHRPSDINQLTPNIHDFLNLPVKYNPSKYVYPLISSSYANTKVQGNVNKYHGNHKNYIVTTYKPMLNPTYFTSKSYYGPSRVIEFTTESAPSPGNSRATRGTTFATSTEATRYNLMNSGMNHPSFKTEYVSTTTRKPVELTTKKTLSLFEQIFGIDYEEGSTEEVDNALSTTTQAPTTTTTIPKSTNDFDTTKEEFYDYEYDDKPTSTTTVTTTTTVKPTVTEKVTSLPLGENHVTTPHRPPLIFAHQNLREKLNNEKVEAPPPKAPPSTSNVHIAPDQDTVSFVVGNHQNVDGGSYVGTSLKESPYDANPFRPVYNIPDKTDVVLYNVPDKKDVTMYNVPEKKDVLMYNFPDKKDVSMYNIPDRKDVLMYNGPDKKDISMYNVPDKKDVLMYNFPDKKDVSMYNVPDRKDVLLYNGPDKKDVLMYNGPDKKDISMYNVPDKKDMVLYSVPDKKDLVPSGSSVTIQPVRQSEASLAIGVPVNRVQVKLGQVVDDKVSEVEYTKTAKIVFPDERTTSTHPPDLSPPPPPLPNREVLKLSSKPMFHQLPSDLTPPTEKDSKIRQRIDRVRPPWDPRPGHFHTGRPEYARPPRPNQEIFKRVDNLPNILPQFRPNMKYQQHHHHHHGHGHNHYQSKNYARQPLLERPSNRPIAFFEKLQPPPIPKLPRRPVEEAPKAEEKVDQKPGYKNDLQEPFVFLQAPPKVVVAKRKNGNDPETLQMIQAKQERKDVNVLVAATTKEVSEKPLYVVYPVNTGPLKLDSIDTNKESVVIGTRAELPLPPSKIAQEKKDVKQPPHKEFNYELGERHDSPILKPRPNTLPIKSNFPYPLERPDPSILSYEVPLDAVENHLPDEPAFSSNQWNTIESHEPSPISVTLKTYTDKPIAVAYTPTEPHADRYFVAPEIRHDSNSEFTVSAVMHTRPQKQDRIDEDSTVPAQDFQAPFLASAHIDHPMSQGWSVVKKDKDGEEEATTVPVVTTSEFNIENFRPQLEGGFKPIYNYPDTKKELVINERQE